MNLQQELIVICPGLMPESRLAGVLAGALKGIAFSRMDTANDLAPLRGRRVLFAVAVGEAGINLEWCKMLALLRSDDHFLDGCTGAVLVDGEGELYTKAVARQLVLAANLAGCAFIGAGLVEATGRLQNFAVRAKTGGCTLEQAYLAAARQLTQRLLEFEWIKHQAPKLLLLHASNRRTSNTMALWDKMALAFSDCTVTEIGLRNGVLVDCSGCPYTTCLHFGERGECFYGGVMAEQVYPSLKEADGVIFLCPNYNDALSANISACINRLTALFRQMRFYDKALFAVVVSGYSGGDLVAEQLLGAVSLNKSFYLPPRFALFETANDAGSALRLPGIDGRLSSFAGCVRDTLCQT